MRGAKYVREDKECYKVPSFMSLGCYGGVWTKLGRVRYVCALVLLVLAVFPGTAYATSYKQSLAGVIQGPSQWYDYGDGTNGGYIGYFVYAYSDFDAALYTLDYDPDQLASEQKAKLSNASTGGKFYEYVQLFHTFGSDSEPSGWLSRDFYGQWVTMYGNDFLYWVEATNQQIVDAKYDLQRVLDGEDLGGGSGSGGDTDNLEFDFLMHYGSGNFNLLGNDGTVYSMGKNYGSSSVLLPSSINVVFEGTYLESFISLVESQYGTVDYNKFYLGLTGQYQNTGITAYIYYSQSGVDVTTQNYTFDGAPYTTYKWTLRDNMVKPNYVLYNSDVTYTFDGSTLTINNKNNTTLVTRLDTITTIYSHTIYSGSSTSNITPVVPPTNWPTDPTPTPTEPPEVPEPPTTTPPTQPTPPTSPTPPTYQPQPVYVTSNFTVDLQGILDAMDEHCQHIQNALYQQSKNLYEDFTSYMSDKYADLKLVLDGNFGYIGDTIDDGFEDLKNYLWDLFKWLKRNMDFTFTSPEYDDSSILSWLKKIYSKMGTGMRSKPVDPVVDPVGAWDWLGQLIQGILGALSGAVGGLTGTVGELFDGIKDKFPFSIPWDLVAILALFDAAPVTPQATIDYTILPNGPVSIPVHWDINLHYLDDTMGTIRAMEDIVFCFYLLLKTDWLSNVFDGIGDYLGGKLRTAMRS